MVRRCEWSRIASCSRSRKNGACGLQIPSKNGCLCGFSFSLAKKPHPTPLRRAFLGVFLDVHLGSKNHILQGGKRLLACLTAQASTLSPSARSSRGPHLVSMGPDLGPPARWPFASPCFGKGRVPLLEIDKKTKRNGTNLF